MSDSEPAARSASFTGATIDRAAELRHDPNALNALISTGEPLAVACNASGVLVAAGGSQLARMAWQGDPSTALLLGIENGRPLLAVDLDAEATGGSTGELRRGDDVTSMSVRDAGAALPAAESGLVAYLVALVNWHRRHRFCSVCGQATDVREAGLSRKCPNCGASHFPRTDPVVIMTVESQGRLLMGSRTGWPSDRYSVLAGFVSSGETPEEAVIREVREESGIEARDAIYVASQPWPFPASLMLGFHAEADGGDPEPGGDDELSDVRWFSRDEVIAMQRGKGSVKLPGEVSIARLLINRWVARSGA
jgi:NAD+ diphosphatase